MKRRTVVLLVVLALATVVAVPLLVGAASRPRPIHSVQDCPEYIEVHRQLVEALEKSRAIREDPNADARLKEELGVKIAQMQDLQEEVWEACKKKYHVPGSR